MPLSKQPFYLVPLEYATQRLRDETETDARETKEKTTCYVVLRSLLGRCKKNSKWKVAVSQMNARPKYKGIGIESGCRWLSRPFAFRPGCAFTELTLEPNKLTRKYSRPGPLHPAKSKVDTITAHLGQGSFSHCSWKRNYEKICQQLRQTCLYCRNWKFLVM